MVSSVPADPAASQPQGSRLFRADAAPFPGIPLTADFKRYMTGLPTSPHPRCARRVFGSPPYSKPKIQRGISPRRFYLQRSSQWAIMPGEGARSDTGLISRRIRDGHTWRLSPGHLCASPRMRGPSLTPRVKEQLTVRQQAREIAGQLRHHAAPPQRHTKPAPCTLPA